eukprot:1297870-Amphidinium_carterae.2
MASCGYSCAGEVSTPLFPVNESVRGRVLQTTKPMRSGRIDLLHPSQCHKREGWRLSVFKGSVLQASSHAEVAHRFACRTTGDALADLRKPPNLRNPTHTHTAQVDCLLCLLRSRRAILLVSSLMGVYFGHPL